MITRDQFDEIMSSFKKEFEQQLGYKRESLLFDSINFIDIDILDNALNEILINFNRDNLPTVEMISKIIFTYLKKDNDQNQLDLLEDQLNEIGKRIKEIKISESVNYEYQ